MSGTLDIGGGRNAVTAGASGSSTQKITIDSEDTTLAEAVSAKALPSVVSITATSSGGQSGSLSQSADGSDSSGSVGSGVVLDTEGHILTNNHVVDGYDQYVVTMDDGTTYEAEFVGNDASSDLAVIKLKDADASKLTPIEIGDSSKLNVGEWVMAIGSPFGNEQSVSTGIVSALYRSTAMSSTNGNTIYANMIQTDAAINRATPAARSSTTTASSWVSTRLSRATRAPARAWVLPFRSTMPRTLPTRSSTARRRCIRTWRYAFERQRAQRSHQQAEHR